MSRMPSISVSRARNVVKPLADSVAAGLIVLVGVIAASERASALSHEQAVANCRETVGHPIVQACMQGLDKGGDREANLAKCRAGASPKVKACVLAAHNAANGRANVAIELYKNGKPKEDVVASGNALPAGFVAPPRTIADITAVLDNEKPDTATLAKLKADADNEPGKQDDLAEFYYARGNARSLLGRNVDALADGEKALAATKASGDGYFGQRLRQFICMQKLALGDIMGALQVAQFTVTDANRPGQKGYLFNAQRLAASILVQMGDIPQAEGYMRRNIAMLQEARTSGLPGWRTNYSIKGRSWEGDVESTRAIVLEARGQFREAEAAYVKGREWRLAAIPDIKTIPHGPPESQMRGALDGDLLNIGRMKAKQGRLAEAEVDVRSALQSRLKAQGKYNPQTTPFVKGLANILIEEGRYEEAEKLTRTALEINRTLNIGDDTQNSAQILAQLGAILTFERKLPEAAAVYAELDRAIAKWEPRRREVLELNGSRINAMFASGQTQAGLDAAQALLKREIARVGEKHFDTASARGILAVGLMRAGKDADAIREFKAALPILLAASRENADDDDASVVAGRSQRLQGIVEAYIKLLANTPSASGDVAAADTFSLADSIRGRSVQQALTASGARASITDPALGELVRNEQDLGKQVSAQLGLLNNILAMPSAERDEKGVKAVNASIEKLRSDRDKARTEINKRFPSYADLVDPKPPSVDQIKATLVDGEAMLSFYFGRDASFVWAVPKTGTVAFAEIKATSGDLESKVRKLRESLEPQAAMISDIPPFDLKLGYELYSLLLGPVEAGWKQSKSLIVVTNGALGLLPLSLLPTAKAQIDPNDDPLFSSYRAVPWLARNYAVTMVPSAAALRTLRQLPPGKPGRGELIAFGDPLFSAEQAAEAEQAEAPAIKVADAGTVTTRGMPLKRRSSPKLEGVNSAELAMLPRLPDTADELKSIALALQADPSKALKLGKDANEDAVKTMNLSGFKVLAFATHGLVPGELNGLKQPALALTAPAVAGVAGDGLLTMEEILALKLDADWVVLSACNTGAGSGAGAEAASGLGRAFFYAGTRALLVTNWSVHSQSARELVTDLFKRQADDPKLTRGEALRQAMMALADGPGYIGANGKSEFAYAHPLFWAPYSIIGDGGVR
jgi:CHAT domain-containing protein